MSNSKDSGLDVAVVGGSLGGLFAAIALERAGCRISVYEQSSGSMSSRGGGIVIQRELTEFFARYDDGDSLLPQTRCSARRIFNPDGSIRSDDGPAQTFTSWDAIFRKLKGTKLEGSYNTGRRVTEYHSENDRPSFELDDGSVVESELIVCSDGSDSTARIQLCPLAGNSYAGYVAWRGYVDESQLPPEVLNSIDDRFCFLHLSDGHILSYPIPGGDGGTTAGERRFNWVWYVDVEEVEELPRMLTDRTGIKRRAAVPPGKTSLAVIEQLQAKARDVLPASLRELVLKTPDPFLQAIFDVTVPTGVFGNICLLGDASFVVRPHTAAATAKAAAEAMALSDLLSSHSFVVKAALARFDEFQQRIGGQLSQHGINLGRR